MIPLASDNAFGYLVAVLVFTISIVVTFSGVAVLKIYIDMASDIHDIRSILKNIENEEHQISTLTHDIRGINTRISRDIAYRENEDGQ